jgi:hypothetical protein
MVMDLARLAKIKLAEADFPNLSMWKNTYLTLKSKCSNRRKLRRSVSKS